MEIFYGIVIFVLGLIIGSFLNVCIYRLPKQASIAVSRSACPACGTPLKPWDMVPVLSYIFLGGKCRYCKAKISIQYPLVEAFTGVLYLLLYLRFGLIWPLPVYLALAALLIVISAIDIRCMEIPNGLVIAGLIVGGLQLIASIFTPYFNAWHSYVIGFFAGGLPLLLIALLCKHVLKKDAMGGGDIKLMAFCGLIIGWKLVITSYLMGTVAGALFGLALITLNKKKGSDAIPFGPFLSLGVLLSVFFGDALIDWYLGLLL